MVLDTYCCRTFTMQMLVVLLTAVLLSCCGPSVAYPQGPPVEACVDMFPTGHEVDAQSSDPPYELVVTDTNLTASTQYSVTLRVKTGATTPHFEGMFVQARLADDCNVTSPIGSFTIPVNDNFMQQMFCNRTNDAVSQRMSSTQTSKSFTWTPPSIIPGTIYFRATVVYNKTTFWTDVFSDFLLPSGAKPNPQYCAVQKKFVPTTTSSSTKVTSTKVSTTLGSSDASTVSSARVLTAVVCISALVAWI